MKMKKFTAVAMAFVMSLSVLATVSIKAQADSTPTDVLYDDFSGNSLDSGKWLIAHKRWGGNNGGVVKENVSVSDGTLKLEGHGLKYEGDVKGIKREDGKLTGAAIATRDYYASGSYEVVAKIAPDLGACSALWTFEYEEYYPGQEGYDPKYATYGYCTVNHEIDIEIPTGTGKNPDPNFSSARFNTYLRENDYTPHYHDLGFQLDDGKYHTYKFDWHTGDTNQKPRVEFYIDNKLMYTSYTDIPTNEGRFWIGLWFPYAIDSDKDGKEDTGWSGLADFDTTVFEIDSVKITPFHEKGDTEQHETYAYDGWAENSFPELAERENYEHIVNGDFSQGEKGWTIEDEAKIENGKVSLTSGQVADSVWQIVNVLPSASYTVTADVVTDGTKVTIGACKENGNSNQYATVTESGKVSLTFNNDTVNTTLKVYAKVDRWQGSNVKVTVDNISFKGTTYVSEPQIDFEPLIPHVITKVAKEDSTCSAYGVKEYYKCEGHCEKYYEDEAAKKEITDLEAWKKGAGRIEKKEHTLKTTTSKASLTENGKRETKCSVCGKVMEKETIYAAKTVKLESNKLTFTGGSQKPVVVIKDSKGVEIDSSNYKLTFSEGRKYVGSYSVKVTFKGDYTGTKTLEFKIVPKPVTIEKLTSGSKSFTATWKQRTSQVTGYELQYACDADFQIDPKKVTIKNNTVVKKEVSDLRAKKTYFVRIRTYHIVEGAKYYSEWSDTSKVTTK